VKPSLGGGLPRSLLFCMFRLLSPLGLEVKTYFLARFGGNLVPSYLFSSPDRMPILIRPGFQVAIPTVYSRLELCDF
jgi:hypothetical protein